MRITGLDEKFDREIKTEDGNLTYYSVDEVECFRSDDYLQQHHDEFQPGCIVGVNVFPSTRACCIRTEAPIWADVNGYSMGEAQTKAFLEKNDMFVAHNWNQQMPALRKADKFSSASDLQRHILVGELGSVGRLNQHTLGYDFVHTVPNGREVNEFKRTGEGLRGVDFAEDDFLILWSGGFNLWCDIETMFEGLEIAMARNAKIHFVSTGGVIDGVDEITYPRFQDMVANSRYKDRFHLKGWIPSEDVPDYFLDCDIGINVDRPCYESVYGARNRITDMMKAGMPVITSLGTEITRIVEESRCGLTFPIGDAESLSSSIVYAAENREELKDLGGNGRRHFEEHFTTSEATRPMWLWARNPTHAPDWDKPKPLQEEGPKNEKPKPWWRFW